MPHDVVGSADGTKSCPDLSCRGHAPQRVSAELRVTVWTQQMGNGPITATHTERRPIEIPEADQRCEFCGKQNEISALTSPPHYALLWPEPNLAPGTLVDLVVAPPKPKETPDERIAKLEREISRMKVGI